ncbi:MAG: hypothetical protein ABSE92_05330 [Terriglobales bacterium]
MWILRQHALRVFAGAALMCATAFSSQASDQSIQRRHGAVHQPAPSVVPSTPAPPTPLTLQQEPAQPPQVSYRDGQLSINAPNSTLADILHAVRTQTGAEMDVPGNPNDRVVGRFGPGPAREVLASLLNGSRYNYVLLGSAANPDGLEHVILSAQTGGVVAAAQAAPVPQQPPQAPQPMAFGGDAEPAEDFGTLSSGNTDAEQPPDVDPQQADDQSAQTQDNGLQPGAQPGGVRSPQQLLQELQQRQQQGQNGQIFQQAPSAPIPGPQAPQQ